MRASEPRITKSKGEALLAPSTWPRKPPAIRERGKSWLHHHTALRSPGAYPVPHAAARLRWSQANDQRAWSWQLWPPAPRPKALAHFLSSLQLPQRTNRRPSTRQLHGIMSDISPVDSPGEPSRLAVGRRAPNSRNSADPCPCQTCETGISIRGAVKSSNSAAIDG